MALRIRRGTEAQRTGVTLEIGEVVWTTDYRQLWVGDGLLPGGYPVVGANVAGYGLSYNATSHKLEVAGLTTDDIAQGSNNKYFSNELAQDATATLFNNGSHTGITFQYDDTGAAINAVVTSEVTQDNIWSMFRDGTHSNITFNYIDNGASAGVINATVTLDGVGIASVQADTAPTLGGNLTLNSRNITGNGNISTTGNITATGALSITGTGLFTSTLTSNTSVSAPIVTATTQLNVGTITSDVNGVDVLVDGTAPLTVVGIGGGGAGFGGQVYFSVKAARGTTALPTTTAAGDSLGGFTIQGYTGTGYSPSSLIVSGWEAGATLSDTFPKSILTLAAGGGGSTLQQATFNSNGVFYAPVIKVSDVAGSLPTPQAGMIVLDGSTFKGYNGSSWVNLN